MIKKNQLLYVLLFFGSTQTEQYNNNLINVLIVGNGGREHALVWKIAQSPQVKNIFVAPGNAGTNLEPKTKNIHIQPTNIRTLANFAQQHNVHLTIVGPESPLAAGIVDEFQQRGLRCFGPTQAAAQIESSKSFAKEFMWRHTIPTAHYALFTDAQKAKNYINKQKTPVVIKADGLAAGKGVIIAQTQDEAYAAIDQMLVHNAFGDAGKTIVIEEFLHGEEVSFIVMTDGTHVLPLATTQDYKKRDDNDKGPNTGGMGAYSPAPIVTPELHQRIMKTIIEPTILGMKKEGIEYTGFLYAGLIITPEGDPKVLEFNCRLGDPETQPMMIRLQSDLITLCKAVLDKNLDQIGIQWDFRPSLAVVLSAGGYPESYRKGDTINGLPTQKKPDYKIFHAGTIENDNNIITNGGRVLCITTLGNPFKDAQKKAYKLAKTIHWPNIYYRTDIGDKAINRP